MKKSSHLVTLFMSSSYLAVGFELTMIPQHQIAYPPRLLSIRLHPFVVKRLHVEDQGLI